MALGHHYAIAIEVELATSLTASGACALAGVVVGKIVANSKDAFNKDNTKLSEVEEAVAEAISKVEAAMSKIRTSSIVEKTAEQLNGFWRLQGYTNSPYMASIVVKEFTLAEKTQFVRVYDNTNSFMSGGWIMKAEDVAGLTAQKIKDKFALENLLKYMCDVEVDEGVTMHCGVAGEIPGWGKGGGIQFDMNNNRTVGNFLNERLIP